MSTVQEIESAIVRLSPADREAVRDWLNELAESGAEVTESFKARIARAREELARALRDGFTAKELDEGRSGLLGFRRLSRAQDDVLAGALVNNLYLERTFEVSARVDAALAALTLEQVNAALRTYLKPQSIDLVFAGDFKP